MPAPRYPVVLLHGFTQTRASWAPVLQALGSRTGVLTPDLPGHGTMADRRPASFDAVTAYVRAAAPERFLLGGYSMGGRLALLVALALPERVERLVLVGATAGIEDATERAARAAADAELADRIERDGIAAFAAEWAASPVLAGQPRGIAAAAHAERLRQSPGGLAAALRGLGTGVMPPVWGRLPELRMPVTLVAGERDEKFSAIATRMAERIPQARVEVARGAGHAVHLEAPDVVAATLASSPSQVPGP